MEYYLLRVATWISQGLNCVFLNGSPDQTVSARAYLNKDTEPWTSAYLWINKLFFWQDNHCKESYEVDVDFAKQMLRLKQLLSRLLGKLEFP